jgi:hypothetical protein
MSQWPHQARFALAHPIYDPRRDTRDGHFWRVDHDTSAGLTVNIGEE